MEEAFIPYFRVVLIAIVCTCVIGVVMTQTGDGGTITTNLNSITTTFFSQFSGLIN